MSAETTKADFNGCVLELCQGDVTQQKVDAIVNAANASLAGGGGVDGAIHRRGGPAIMAETDKKYPDGCPTGSAVISGAGNLDANYVIHAVAPRWRDGTKGEPQQLAGAYRASLELADEHGCKSVALPSLGTGAYRYPLDQAAKIALSTAIEYLREKGKPKLVRFVLFDGAALEEFRNALFGLMR